LVGITSIFFALWSTNFIFQIFAANNIFSFSIICGENGISPIVVPALITLKFSSVLKTL
jgi:hypothetical protein